jgi:putative Ca2+/H+ antiporter (TMEM165/GDT1 family)
VLETIKKIMLLICAVYAVYVGLTITYALPLKQIAILYGFVFCMFFLGLFFGMDDDDE